MRQSLFMIAFVTSFTYSYSRNTISHFQLIAQVFHNNHYHEVTVHNLCVVYKLIRDLFYTYYTSFYAAACIIEPSAGRSFTGVLLPEATYADE